MLNYSINLLDIDLIGVCPEKQIQYPRVQAVKKVDNELSAGHTHMFMINNEGDISDEEAEDKEEEETVQHLFGKPINEKEKKKFDEAASKIQKGWAMKK